MSVNCCLKSPLFIKCRHQFSFVEMFMERYRRNLLQYTCNNKYSCIPWLRSQVCSYFFSLFSPCFQFVLLFILLLQESDVSDSEHYELEDLSRILFSRIFEVPPVTFWILYMVQIGLFLVQRFGRAWFSSILFYLNHWLTMRFFQNMFYWCLLHYGSTAYIIKMLNFILVMANDLIQPLVGCLPLNGLSCYDFVI